jgi:mannosylfructose-6-phosphate phosphatase
MSRARFDWMLVSDLDGTLLGDGPSLARFHRLWPRQVRPRACLVYSSGRFIESMRQSVRETDLPEPDFWIGGVGTEIETAEATPLPGWREQLDQGWDRAVALDTLENWPGVQLQPAACLSRYKVSGYWFNATAPELANLESVLLERGCKARVLYSSNRDVDVLPASANKGTSALFLAQQLGLEPDRVACSGDSGNDIDLYKMGFGSPILVGNATPDLVRQAPSAYQAVSRCAGGVLEGLRHYGLLRK